MVQTETLGDDRPAVGALADSEDSKPQDLGAQADFLRGKVLKAASQDGALPLGERSVYRRCLAEVNRIRLNRGIPGLSDLPGLVAEQLRAERDFGRVVRGGSFALDLPPESQDDLGT